MSKFERIIREPLVMGGQARIRDTGITVNEIVRLSLAGSSQAEILQQFPQIEAEDVHQALGWQAQDMISLLADSMREQQARLTSINGYADIISFLLKTNGNLSYELTHDKISSIQVNVIRIWESRNTVLAWLDGLSELGKPLETKQINWDALKAYLESNTIKYSSVLARTSPIDMLKHLIIGKLNYYEEPDLAKLIVEKINKELHFTVIRNGQLETSMLEHPSGLAIANLLIFDSGSELKIRQEENTVIFEFALPVVESES